LTFTVDGLEPRDVEAPSNYETVAELLKRAADERCALVPYGGGTMLDLGGPLPRADIAISLEKLDQVLDHQPANLTVRTQAGITLAALNQILAQHGQYLPLDPPFPERATVGGILAANASGPLRVRFGTARDLVTGVRVALADGQIVRGGGDVVKNVAGYDLPKLFIGSLGTLGVIVEATLKIAPMPAKSATITAEFDRLERACDLALRILHSPHLPFALEILNPVASTELGLGKGYVLAVRYAGLDSAVAQQVREVDQWAGAMGALGTAQNENDSDLWARIRDFIFVKPVVVKVGVLPTQIAEVASEAERLGASALGAHAIGVVYASFADDAGAARAIQAFREFVNARRGHLIVQRGSRELREAVGVWGPPRSDWKVMEKLQREFDPYGILNPGRLAFSK
jgi:glycolate dehydrogenase FAD-binding subunit